MAVVDVLDPFGRRDDREQPHARRAGVLDELHRVHGRVAGREHRVEQDDVAVRDVGRQLHVVLDRAQRLLVAVETDEADARARDQRQHAVEHPEPRAQDRAHGDLLAGDARERLHLERRLDVDVLGREILRRLVGEEQRDLLDELAEVDGRRVLVPQVRQLVLDERVSDLGDAQETYESCSRGSPGTAAACRRARARGRAARRRSALSFSESTMIDATSAEVVFVEAAHRRCRCAEAHARRDHRRPLVERHRVAVRGQPALLETLLRGEARPLGCAQVELNEVRVGAAGENVVPAVDQRRCRACLRSRGSASGSP